MARVKLVMPQGPRSGTDLVVHLAGTGDHGFERRLHLGFPLIKQVTPTSFTAQQCAATQARRHGRPSATRMQGFWLGVTDGAHEKWHGILGIGKSLQLHFTLTMSEHWRTCDGWLKCA